MEGAIFAVASIVATARELIADATRRLEPFSQSPRLDVELLLAEVLQVSRTKLIVELRSVVSESARAHFESLLSRRMRHEPVAYILGRKECFGFDFMVSPSVLIPRPETECLVEDALSWSSARARPVRVLDLGTGSGCLAVTLANSLAARGRLEGRVVAIDLSEDALLVAKKNALQLGAERLVEFRQGSWFSAIHDRDLPFDLVVSNPPYIAEADTHRSPETEWEPKMALLSGEDGLRDIRQILAGVSRIVRAPALLLVEVGASHRLPVEALCRTCLDGSTGSIDISWIPDLAGYDRILRVEFCPSK